MTRSLIDHVRETARAGGNTPALLAPNREPLDHGSLADAVDRLAAGLPPGAIVATVLPAGPDAVLMALAAMQAGAVLPLNPDGTSSELATALDRMRPSLVVMAEGSRVEVPEIARTRGIPVAVLSAGRATGTISLEFTAGTPQASPRLPDGTRMLLQTSGTTALPKVVPLTEANLMAAAEAIARSMDLGPGDRALNLLPQFHIGGLWDLVAGPLITGGGVICGGVFSRRAFADGLTLDPTWVQLAPPMIADLLADPGQGALGLRVVRSVSAALPADLRAAAEQRLRVPIVEIYGMTETAGVITSQPLDRQDGSVGRPVRLEVKIVHGEIVVSGPQVSPGYLLADAQECARFGTDGFRTGDLGRIDAAGHLWITGRANDLINRGGEKVAPAEVEAALRSLPWVTDAAVFAVPHPVLGQEIAAALVCSGGPEDAATAARKAVRQALGHGRVPAVVHVLDSLPRSAGGKLLRRALRERFPDVPVMPVSTADVKVTPVGDWVAGIWSAALGISPVAYGDDFFLLGGTSLQAAQAVALMQERFPDAIIYVSALYESPTPVEFEAFLQRRYPDICAAILDDRAIEMPPVPPLTDAESLSFEAAVRCPEPPFRDGEPNPRAAFILSAPRSGSTMLRVMLAGHPALFAPPELYLLSHRDLSARREWFGQAHASQLEGLPRALMAATGADSAAAIAMVRSAEAAAMPSTRVFLDLQKAVAPRLLVDKTPFYSVHPETLSAIDAAFPDAVYIHLTRHPYGMIRSFERAQLDQLWWPRLTGPGGGDNPFHARQLAELLWTRAAATTTAFLQNIPPERKIHVRYETLVADPLAELQRVCRTLGIAYDPAMMSLHERDAQRMTDGLHAASRMIGDPSFHRHRGVSRGSAYAWREEYSADFLAPCTVLHATRLGHAEVVLGVHDTDFGPGARR